MSTRASSVASSADWSNLCWTCLLAKNGRSIVKLPRNHAATRIGNVTSRSSIFTAASIEKHLEDPNLTSSARVYGKRPSIRQKSNPRSRCEPVRHISQSSLWNHRSPRDFPLSIASRDSRKSCELLGSSQRYLQRNYHDTKRRSELHPQRRRIKKAEPHIEPAPSSPQPLGIRDRLKTWKPDDLQSMSASFAIPGDIPKPGDIQNGLSRSANISALEDDEEASTGPASSLATLRDGEIVDVDINALFLRPGDLVELRHGSSDITLGIVTQEFESEFQFYTMQGKWTHRPNKGINFGISAFVSPEIIEQLLPHLPSAAVAEELKDKLYLLDTTVPREVGASAVRSMLSFWNKADKVYRQYASVLEDAHNLLAHETRSRITTTREVAARLLGDKSPSQATLYAVHRILTSDYGFAQYARNHRVTGETRIRSKSEVAVIRTVQEWMRQYQEDIIANIHKDSTNAAISEKSPIHAFLLKARNLVGKSRSMRIPVAHGLCPRGRDNQSAHGSAQRDRCVFSHEFDEKDEMIIRFLQAWSSTRSFSSQDSLNSIAAMLVRAVGMYHGQDIDKGTGFLFLQELGVYSPWENRIAYDDQLGLPGHGTSEQADKLAHQSLRIKSMRMQDAMQDLRKDWGPMEVYCIDDADAKEIDDGFSVEPIPGMESEFWIHTHIANPSAFITPSSTPGQYAEILTQSVYFPERTYSMLSPKLTRDCFSLASGRPTLTFSARVNISGNLLETKVTSGIIRKVTFITPEKAQQVIDGRLSAASRPENVITVGGQMPSRAREGLDNDLTTTQIQELKLLAKLGQSRRTLRMERGYVSFNIPRPTISVLNDEFNNFFQEPSFSRGRYYEEDPIIELRAPSVSMGQRPRAAKIVEDIMQLACEVAGRWCSDRNIPMPYRCTVAHPGRQDPTDFYQSELRRLIDEAGNVPFRVGIKYINLFRGVASTTPASHMLLGAKRYVKVTSPLRRFGDLLSHWQIESALRYEARGHSLLAEDLDPFQLAYSKLELDWRLGRIEAREKMLGRAEKNADRHWLVQLLYRCFYAQEAKLPETFKLLVYSKGATAWSGKYSGIIEPLGLDVDMEAAEGIGLDADLGDWWEVRIKAVDPYHRKVVMEPVRLISKGEKSLL